MMKNFSTLTLTIALFAASMTISSGDHGDTIKLCYRVTGNADSSIPVNNRETIQDGYGRVDCPPGQKAASGTVYRSWPDPVKHKNECYQYSGCQWAGLFSAVWANDGSNCRNPAQVLPRPDGGDYKCRFPKQVVRKWKVAATWEGRKELLNKKVQVWVAHGHYLGEFNIIDTCSDSDCNACCSKNTANGKYPLIDMEVMAYCQTGICDAESINIENLGYPRNNRPV